MKTTEMTSSEFWEMRGRLCAGYVAPKRDDSVVCLAPPDTEAMKPLTAYRGEGWALCKYISGDDFQQAFNLVAACFPQVLVDAKWIITVINPAFSPQDPFGLNGYVAIRAPKGGK